MAAPSNPTDAPSGGSYTVAGPNGLTCATTRDFIVVGGLLGDRFSIQWGAIGDPTSWPTPNTDAARAVQAGKQTFPSKFGWVTGIAGNDFYMYVFQVRAISKATYIGGDVVWSFDTFEEDRGCVKQGMLESIDDMVVFESDRGRHLLQNDQIVDIGFGKTDDTL